MSKDGKPHFAIKSMSASDGNKEYVETFEEELEMIDELIHRFS